MLLAKKIYKYISEEKVENLGAEGKHNLVSHTLNTLFPKLTHNSSEASYRKILDML